MTVAIEAMVYQVDKERISKALKGEDTSIVKDVIKELFPGLVEGFRREGLERSMDYIGKYFAEQFNISGHVFQNTDNKHLLALNIRISKEQLFSIMGEPNG